MFNMYPELVEKLNELLEENRKYKRLLNRLPKKIKYLMATSKKVPEEDREEWKKLYEERSKNDNI